MRNPLPIVTLALAALAACSTAKPTPDADAVKQVAQKPAEAEQQAASVSAANDTAAEGNAQLLTALKDLSNVSVFFGTDDDVLSAEAKEKLATVGQLLGKYGSLRVRIEGNCDERGTSAYNLALGQRRANAAAKYLVQMGARDEQLAALSNGNEKPKAEGHGEEAWAQNRRDDVVAVQSHQ